MALDPQFVAIPLYLGLIGLEVAVTRRERQQAIARGEDPRTLGYAPKDTVTSLAMGIGSVVVNLAAFALLLAMAMAVYDVRILDLGSIADGATGLGPAILAWTFLVLADDFIYYWFHRMNHRVRLFWAAHVVHHSSQRYNYSTALRQSWTDLLPQMVLVLPLFLIGFTPAQWAVVHGFNLIYQFWIHTEVVDRLWRPLEYLLNTPSHHRVHHGSDREYLDKNYGGILIVFDRWFGTFEPEGPRPTYGLTKNITSYNPFYVAGHEYAAIVKDVSRAPSWRARVGLVIGPPGWQPAEANPVR